MICAYEIWPEAYEKKKQLNKKQQEKHAKALIMCIFPGMYHEFAIDQLHIDGSIIELFSHYNFMLIDKYLQENSHLCGYAIVAEIYYVYYFFCSSSDPFRWFFSCIIWCITCFDKWCNNHKMIKIYFENKIYATCLILRAFMLQLTSKV